MVWVEVGVGWGFFFTILGWLGSWIILTPTPEPHFWVHPESIKKMDKTVITFVTVIFGENDTGFFSGWPGENCYPNPFWISVCSYCWSLKRLINKNSIFEVFCFSVSILTSFLSFKFKIMFIIGIIIISY